VLGAYDKQTFLSACLLFDVIAECGLTGHTYADDTQVYISTPATDHIDAVDRLAACIERIRDWLADNHLKLNEEKTLIIWLVHVSS